MSDVEDGEPAPKKKKSKLPIIIGLVAVVLIGGGAAAVLLMAPAKAEGGGAPAPSASAVDNDLVRATVSIDPIVVDVRDADGVVHHLKVSLSMELAEGVAEADFRSYVPRGREAAITFLRAQTFEDLVAADRFETVRLELSKRVITAVGEKRATRILVTDYVAQ